MFSCTNQPRFPVWKSSQYPQLYALGRPHNWSRHIGTFLSLPQSRKSRSIILSASLWLHHHTALSYILYCRLLDCRKICLLVLTLLTVAFLAQVAWSRLLGSLVHNELGMKWKEVVVAYIDVQSRCLLGEIRNTTKNLRMAGLRLEMWNRYLPNAKQEYCPLIRNAKQNGVFDSVL